MREKRIDVSVLFQPGTRHVHNLLSRSVGVTTRLSFYIAGGAVNTQLLFHFEADVFSETSDDL